MSNTKENETITTTHGGRGLGKTDAMRTEVLTEGSFERISELWMHWSVKTFEKATSHSSIDKCKKELEELQVALVYSSKTWQLYEYADAIMCLLHSAAKQGFTLREITDAFREKAGINFKRKWKLDASGNTYSHVKQ